MDLISWEEKQVERLKVLMLINPKICLEQHQKDLKACKDYLNNENIKDFEELLVFALNNVECYLKHNKKRLGIENDYLDVLGDISLTVLKKLATFRGGSLFSTWVRGIMRYALLKHYSKKCKLNETKLPENLVSRNQIEEFEGQEKIREYFLVLNKQEAFVIKAIVFNGYTIESLADKIKRPIEMLHSIYCKGLNKIKDKMTKRN
ncbi:MAG: sigma-70 family RNA polymerase sigma factor [Firmicutes bacterium]|nr:sigma-70 family RNA polymerase sigma factor [Bacillota bacterium]